MAWTQQDLEAIENAIKQGAKRVKYGDKEVEYHSLDDLFRIRNEMLEELNPQENSGRRYAEFSKGLGYPKNYQDEHFR